MLLTFRYVVAAFLACVACEGGTTPTPGARTGADAAAPPPTTSLGADFKAKYIEATCAVYVRCGLSRDTTDCRRNYFEAGAIPVDTVVEDIDRGVVLFDSAGAAPCFKAITDLPCAIPELADITTRDTCASVLHGTLPLQAPCVQGIECASGFCEKSSGCTGCCLGTCAPPKAPSTAGAPCRSSRECQEVDYCDLSTGSTGPYVCRTRLAMGAACTLSIACPSGAECAGDASNRTCQPQPQNGEPCAKTGPKCHSLGAYCDSTTRTCRPGNLPGEPCPTSALSITSNGGCALYTRCQSGVCEPFPGIGETCTLPPDATVPASSVCRAGTCVANLCSPRTDPMCTVQSASRPDAGP